MKIALYVYQLLKRTHSTFSLMGLSLQKNKNHNKRKNAIENYGNFVHTAHLSQVVKAVLVFVAC